MTALILRSLSYSVHILERSSVSTLHSQAAGIRAGPELHSFISTYVPDYDPEYALAPDVFEIVKQNGEVEMAIPPTDPLRLTTWKRVYDMFLGTFLGGKDGDGDGDGKAVYETCMKVENIKEEGNGKVLVTYRNLDNDTTRTLTADLVIGADGAHSTVRRIVAQDVDVVQEPQYAGYVTWRGRVPEGNVGQETRRALRKRCVLMRVRDGYMISYVSITYPNESNYTPQTNGNTATTYPLTPHQQETHLPAANSYGSGTTRFHNTHPNSQKLSQTQMARNTLPPCRAAKSNPRYGNACAIAAKKWC
jgi:hypothetical protein